MEAISAGHGAVHFQVNRELLVQVCRISRSLQLKKKQNLTVLTSLVIMFSTVFQKMLEQFEQERGDAFGLNSELLAALKTGTTLVEYR